MPDPRDHIQISASPAGRPGGSPSAADGASRAGGRPWISVWFRCSGQYLRVYRNAAGDGYLARCPKCAKPIRFRVGAGGTDNRFFEVSC